MTAKILESFIDTNILVYSIDLSPINRQYHLSNIKIIAFPKLMRYT